MDFTQSIDNGYMIPTSVAVGSGEATDIRCVCDTVEDFKTFLDATEMELRYEGLVTYEKINKLLKVYKGNNEWQVVGEGGGSVDTSSFITLTQLSQQLNGYYTKIQTDNKISEEIAKIEVGDKHTHSNLSVLNNITQTKIKEWDGKADASHTHTEYASSSHTHDASEIEGLENVDIDLSDYYTKSETYNKTEIDSKIANMGAGGSVDLSNYYTKSETDEAMNDKADKVHTHNEYLTELPTHTHSEYLTELPSHEHEQYLTEHQDISHKADKSDIYTKIQTDNKISEEIAKAQLGGSGEVDLSAYATKTYVDNEISKISNKMSEVDELIHQLTNNRTIDGGEL